MGFVFGASESEVFILTARRVVATSQDIRVQFFDPRSGGDFPGALKATSSKADFAVVAVSKSVRSGAPLPAFQVLNVGRDAAVMPKRKLATIGYPLGRGWWCKSGEVKEHVDRGNDRMFLLTTTPHEGRFSGAPVFDEWGILLGMATEGAPGGGGRALAINYMMKVMRDEDWQVSLSLLREPVQRVMPGDNSPRGPKGSSENLVPSQPPGGPYIILQDKSTELIVNQDSMKEFELQKKQLRELIEEGKKIMDRPDSYKSKKNAFYGWKAECGQVLDNMFQTQQHKLLNNPPRYRDRFDEITELREEGPSEAELLQLITCKLSKAVGYLRMVVAAPLGGEVKEPLGEECAARAAAR
ncbi:MAG TPA: serine protease [Pyrinomonadaceae bacterium]|nr:serine protease [Pyrinomonadaceae bacterium]